MKFIYVLIYALLLLNCFYITECREKLLCEEIIENNLFNEKEIIKQIDRNMDILKTQLKYETIYNLVA